MPVPRIERAWRATLVSQYHGQQIVNSLGWVAQDNLSQTATPFAATALARAFFERWAQHVVVEQADAVQFQSCQVYSLEDQTVTGTWAPAPVNGGKTLISNSPSMPGAICANVQLLSSRRGRRFNGRTGLAGIMESDVNGNLLSSGTVSRLNLAMEKFRAAMLVHDEDPSAEITNNAEGFLAIISEKYGLATPVTECRVKSLIGTRVARIR